MTPPSSTDPTVVFRLQVNGCYVHVVANNGDYVVHVTSAIDEPSPDGDRFRAVGVSLKELQKIREALYKSIGGKVS